MPLAKLFSKKITKEKSSHSTENPLNTVKNKGDVIPFQTDAETIEIIATDRDVLNFEKDNVAKEHVLEEKCIGNQDALGVESIGESIVDGLPEASIEYQAPHNEIELTKNSTVLNKIVDQKTSGIETENKESNVIYNQNSLETDLMLFGDNQFSDSETATHDVQNEEFNKHKTYMRSISENDTNKHQIEIKRKKCYSESGLPEDDILQRNMIFEDVIRKRGKNFEDAISKCVDKMIRESIASAIKSVDVESLYEEIVKDIYDCKLSSSSDENNVYNDEACAEKIFSETRTSRNDISSSCEEISCSDKEEGASDEIVTEVERLEQKSRPNELENGEKDDEEVPEYAVHNGCNACPNTVDQDSVLDDYHADCEESTSIRSNASSDGKIDENTSETFDLEQKVSGKDENCLEYASDFKQQLSMTGKMIGSNEELLDVPEKELVLENMKKDIQGSVIISPKQADSSLTATDTTEKEFSSFEEGLDEIPQKQYMSEEEKKNNWKVGYLHVKSPHKSRGKTHFKVWKKRCVSIQPDEFVHDPKYPSIIISVYSAESGTSRKHNASFWKTISCKKAVVYRSNSRSHRYSFTISDENNAVIHLAADTETLTQEWMAAIRAILWPPSPVVQLEKMLTGNKFDISLIDNDFSFHAGLLGMYGYLNITPKKLILLHPQQGYVIQEWYLNTVDKFQVMPQSKVEDVNKVLSMTTCSDSSTGKGEILLFCNDAVSLLETLAHTIHEVLTRHSKQDGGKYEKELQNIADWLIGPTSTTIEKRNEDYYKVPPRQVKSLLDIPNFIFEKSLSPVASMADTTSAVPESMKELKTNPTRSSHDSGISTETAMDDLLNCSVASFILGGGALTGKSSDSELSDAYSPPCSPNLQKKHSKVLNAEGAAEITQT